MVETDIKACVLICLGVEGGALGIQVFSRLISVSIIHIIRKSLGISQHKSRRMTGFGEFWGAKSVIFGLYNQILALETNIKIQTDQNTHWQISFHNMTLVSRWKCVRTILSH